MKQKIRPVVLVHGGAGTYAKAAKREVLAGCERAAHAGFAVLRAGGGALDAAVAAVRVLEDDPQFNAGTGSVLTSAGTVEMDASVMEGHTQRAGAVGAVTRLQNPVLLARAIMDEGRHVLLVGEGAADFARVVGMEEYPEASLRVERQYRRWQEKHGTVGAVARDARGRLAAATSTGGLFDKRPGRVGDSAVIGAGTWADDRAAVSCTGLGEAIIRTALAKAAADFVREGNSPQRAARRAVNLLARLTDATAGLIVLGVDGRPGFAFNTPHMAIAHIVADEKRALSAW